MPSPLRLLSRLAREIRDFLAGLHVALVEQSTEALELEMLELEHAFLTLVLGSLVGLPLAPLGLAAELAPLLEDEVRVLYERTWRGGDVISDLFSRLGGEW